ncbi:uncharacterized protein LOC129598872 [Paramacrobiotus metropolitanus]|uniref:uncharacterized protein LOC129598872 n=1 Tax=Paramacrobiotus metropolitanus TaxID=2943436 RepID=UPI0024461F31|nr:uncharacterized protein LOC129598872 [Paramacrobiotus metropolitanus]
MSKPPHWIFFQKFFSVGQISVQAKCFREQGSAQITLAMTLKYAAWMHGNAIRHSNNWNTTYTETSAVLRLGSGSRTGVVHLPVPAPVIIDDRRLRFMSVLLRYRSRGGATVTGLSVYDGERCVTSACLSHQAANYDCIRVEVKDQPQVLWGPSLTVRIDFGNNSDAAVEIVSAGIDFRW